MFAKSLFPCTAKLPLRLDMRKRAYREFLRTLFVLPPSARWKIGIPSCVEHAVSMAGGRQHTAEWSHKGGRELTLLLAKIPNGSSGINAAHPAGESHELKRVKVWPWTDQTLTLLGLLFRRPRFGARRLWASAPRNERPHVFHPAVGHLGGRQHQIHG